MTFPPLRNLVTALFVMLALAAGLAVLDARPAAAHDALARAVPAADETVTTELSSVTLTFSETPLAEFANAIALNVTDPTGASVTTGAPVAEGTTLSVPVEVSEAGLHTVTWQSVSSDGHTISGTYTFTYAGPVAAAAPTTPAPAASTPAASPSATAEPTAPDPTQTAAGPASTNSIPLIIGVTTFAALMLIPLIVVRLLRARRRKKAEMAAPETAGTEE
ncbi:copper resistance CopC family protein [Frigoribacterium sp. Leaf186]|uniref:copper resistance CopC family protein n=1 Tax=Frigoribacterium sp. Leaf186 TaxID=1736293 RepID=UPI0009E763BB|nr:copper resistance CopC family protein [Frigoribacterium sp. Leaf186]